MEAKNGIHGVHHGKGFCNFMVYTMEEDFGFSWCTQWMLKMVFMVYAMEGDFAIMWCTPWKGILQFRGVYTMEARNAFRGVHIFSFHGVVSWCIHHGS